MQCIEREFGHAWFKWRYVLWFVLVWMIKIIMFHLAHTLTLILAVQKCLQQLILFLHGFEVVHRQTAMLRITLVLVWIWHLCCTRVHQVCFCFCLQYVLSEIYLSEHLIFDISVKNVLFIAHIFIMLTNAPSHQFSVQVLFCVFTFYGIM